ncbi:hypothetical protein RQP46_004667 [Phenoliferia psychrophenolica]
MDEDGLASAVAALAAGPRSAFEALHNAHPSEPIAGIIKSNALPHEGGQSSEGGIYEVGCRLNHSCRPSTNHHFDAGRQLEVFVATRNVDEGEELTDYYTFLLNPAKARQADLLERFGFTCSCEVCSLPPSALADSDKRRASISATIDAIPSLVGSPLRLIIKVRQALKDCAAEGLVPFSVAIAWDAYQVAILYGDEASAKKWARRMLEYHILADGLDSTEVVEARRLEAEGPRKDPRFGKHGRKTVGGPE